MNDIARIRQQLDFARARCADVAKACDEAEAAIRSKDERRLRLFVGIAHAEALRLRGTTNKACDSLNRLSLEGLLGESLRAKGAANG
jgi:hypothetical protein